MPKLSVICSLWLCSIWVLFSKVSCFKQPTAMLRSSSSWVRLADITETKPRDSVSDCSPGAAVVVDAQEGLVDSPLFLADPLSPLADAELADENLLLIVKLVASDQQCNTLAWKCLGYTYHPHNQSYSNEGVFRSFRARFPTPPDLIGVTRDYSSGVDRVVRDASMHLMRSVPPDFKGGVRASLRPLGFRGYQLSELTPNKTRRAQLANWLIFFRETFFKKRTVHAGEASSDDAAQQTPSEKMYRSHRLDQ